MAHTNGPATAGAGGACRWRLNRAGIVNVYQYGNEILHFAGGRLLLRGVNGSGKSTAMNMLLPFLLTTREGRIDAAGEQSGILKSWMLNGRDDAQPVGYLWIEFEHQGEFVVCGCGIKANRQSDSVNTWWFITSKRPGIDLDLVSGGAALSAEALRVILDGDEVYGKSKRRDYRRAVEQRLFAGASIDQHVRLINKVRSPRVGDRIDLELRDYLVDALPQVSEPALTEAAQPLDDLDEHRRTVAELARTLDAARGLLDVYRSYCVSDLRQRLSSSQQHLAKHRDLARGEQRSRRAVEAASGELARLDGRIDELEAGQRRLRREIEALEKSRAYQQGQQLEGIRELVLNLAHQCETATARVKAAEQRTDDDAREVHQSRLTSLKDRDALNDGLATASESARHCRLDRQPPGPVTVPEGCAASGPTAITDLATASGSPPSGQSRDEAPEGSDRTGPKDPTLAGPGPLDLSGADRELAASISAVGRRRSDIEQLRSALEAERDAARGLTQAETAHRQAASAVDQAKGRLAEATRQLNTAHREWHQQVRDWAAGAVRLMGPAGLGAPVATVQAREAGKVGEAGHAAGAPPGSKAEPAEPDTLRARLHAEADALVDHWQRAAVTLETQLEQDQRAEQEARSHLEELESRVEPEAPRLGWQLPSDWCLADLIDFAPGLAEPQRAGLEAAMEASGLLSARLADAAFELESGELVAVASQPVSNPLSDLLSVTVPQRLQGQADRDSVLKLLESISCEPGTDAATVVTVCGEFRVGSLRGRHRKDRAEQIGATARRAALDKAREEARRRLDQASDAALASRVELERCQQAHVAAKRLRDSLPDTTSILGARARVNADTAALAEAATRRDDTAAAAADAERELSRLSDALHRAATSLALPKDKPGLDALERDLTQTAAVLERCCSQVVTLTRSVQTWKGAYSRWRQAASTLEKERVDLRRVELKHADESASLATLEDSVGAEYKEVIAARDGCRAELADLDAAKPELREEQRRAVDRRAEAQAAAQATVERAAQAERDCESARVSLDQAIMTPGYLNAIRAGPAIEAPDSPTSGTGGVGNSAITARTTGSDGLREMVETLTRVVADAAGQRDPQRGVRRIESPEVRPDGVRQSLLQRRDALGAGWDAEDRQPEPTMPLVVEVTGPSGRATLAESVRAVAEQHQQVSGLLSSKQDEALRQLLQGMIAREIAQKIFAAERLVQHMNRRLGEVATAHRVGVRLRWRRSGELDAATARMVQLLAKTPDVRTDDETGELRQALSSRLDEARAEQPDVSYRQLIAETLDYKQWHDMAVMVRRGGQESRLSRSTPLSEGEKKLVAYLPLFAAVSASCDALAEQQAAPGEGTPGIARFVLLDDAFAKVSEDNHAALFGLLVGLDLDFIATSERLWGTHGTVPELAVTEVIRDAALSTILLEHYRWNGNTLSLGDGT